MKTRRQIDELIASWRDDRGWDIEDSEGFEEHREELLAVRLKIEAAEDAAAARRREEEIAAVMERAVAILPTTADDKHPIPTQDLARTPGSTIHLLLRMVAEIVLPLQQRLERQAEDIERLQERDP